MELMDEGKVTRRGRLAMHLPETTEPETGPSRKLLLALLHFDTTFKTLDLSPRVSELWRLRTSERSNFDRYPTPYLSTSNWHNITYKHSSTLNL
jgi:hypothetical protein